jgi:hypothetical protein
MDQLTQKSRTQSAALERRIRQATETGEKNINVSLTILTEIIEDRAKANNRRLELEAFLTATFCSFVMIILKLLPSNHDVTVSQLLSILGDIKILSLFINVLVTLAVFSFITNITTLPNLGPQWVADCKTKTGKVFVISLILLLILGAIYLIYKLLPLK